MNAAMPSFVSLKSANSNIYGINLLQCIHTKKRNPNVMALPTTSTHLLQHMLRAHLQILLWKSANCEGTAGESQTLGGSFESKLIYRSLLKATLLHLSYLM